MGTIFDWVHKFSIGPCRLENIPEQPYVECRHVQHIQIGRVYYVQKYTGKLTESENVNHKSITNPSLYKFVVYLKIL